jgi:hypothetical protein
MTFQELIVNYRNNPYGMGADEAYIHGGGMSFYNTDCEGQDKLIQKLKEMGYPKNKMCQSMRPKGCTNRYRLSIYK